MRTIICRGPCGDAGGAAPAAGPAAGLSPHPGQLQHPILYAYDDPAHNEDLRRALLAAGFAVLVAHSTREARARQRSTRLALLLVDLELADMDDAQGLALLQSAPPVPVVPLSTHAADEEIVRWLQRGAAAYVVKPFRAPVEVSRIAAVVRRSQLCPPPRPRAPRRYRLGAAVFDPEANTLRGPDRTCIRLTATEGHILRVLLANEGHVLPTRRLVEQVHGYADPGSVSALRMHVMHLRRKLAQLPTAPPLIRTVPGVGYGIIDGGRTALD